MDFLAVFLGVEDFAVAAAGDFFFFGEVDFCFWLPPPPPLGPAVAAAAAAAAAPGGFVSPALDVALLWLNVWKLELVRNPEELVLLLPSLSSPSSSCCELELEDDLCGPAPAAVLGTLALVLPLAMSSFFAAAAVDFRLLIAAVFFCLAMILLVLVLVEVDPVTE